MTPPKYYEAGHFYHVYNRGNRKQPIFFRQKDYERFLKRYVVICELYNITTYAFCLMPNHFHFLVQPGDDTSLHNLFTRLATSHAKYINIKYELTGSLFQRGFQAKKIVEEPHLLHVSRYIHENSIDLLGSTLRVEPENILNQIIAYPWSSLAQFQGEAPRTGQPICAVDEFFEIASIQSWEKYRSFVLDDIVQEKHEELYTFNPSG